MLDEEQHFAETLDEDIASTLASEGASTLDVIANQIARSQNPKLAVQEMLFAPEQFNNKLRVMLQQQHAQGMGHLQGAAADEMLAQGRLLNGAVQQVDGAGQVSLPPKPQQQTRAGKPNNSGSLLA